MDEEGGAVDTLGNAVCEIHHQVKSVRGSTEHDQVRSARQLSEGRNQVVGGMDEITPRYGEHLTQTLVVLVDGLCLRTRRVGCDQMDKAYLCTLVARMWSAIPPRLSCTGRSIRTWSNIGNTQWPNPVVSAHPARTLTTHTTGREKDCLTP